MDKDSIYTGIVLGMIVPVIGYLLIEQLFQGLIYIQVMPSAEGSISRLRTIALIAICCNLLPFRYARLRYYDYTMRGIIFPTLVYVGLWLYKFGGDLF